MDKSNRKHNQTKISSLPGIDRAQLKPDQPQFSTGDLGKIQEILFGQQLRSNMDQIARLNTELEQRLTSLSDSCQKQFSDLQTKLADGIESLRVDQIERDKKLDARIETLDRQHSSLEGSLLAKLKDTSNNSAQIKQQLSDKIETTNKSLSHSLDATRKEFAKTLEQALVELRSQKIDRESLSTLLTEMATQLSDAEPNPDESIDR